MKKIFFLCAGLFAVHSMMAQNVGIGTSSPTAKLHVNGTIKISNGTQGAGKILTSDAAGLASWQSPPSSESENNFPAVGICCQSWMTKNLDVATYRNGDTIPHVTGNAEWLALTTGAYCYFDNDSATYAATYGKLYNWYAINDSRGLAPEGWHIPSEWEWINLGTCLSGNEYAGGYMKETGLTHWNDPNTDASNYSGFTALPGGDRYNDGTFASIGALAIWWSSTAINADDAYAHYIINEDFILFVHESPKGYGYSVRCIKD